MWTDPVMKFIGISTGPRRIVGIVAGLDDESIIPAPNMTVYHPFEQKAPWAGQLFVRTQKDPDTLVPPSRALSARLLPVSPSNMPACSKIFARKCSRRTG